MRHLIEKVALAAMVCLGLAGQTMAQDTDLEKYDNVLYVRPASTTAPGQLPLSIQMKNTLSITSYQVDIQLPKGWKVAQDEDGEYMYSLSTERTTARRMTNIAGNQYNDSIFRLLNYTTSFNKNANTLYTFDGNDGEVATVTVDIPSDAVSGEYKVVLSHMELVHPVNADSIQTIKVDDPIVSTITVVGTATGISSVHSVSGQQPIYSLGGQLVSKDGKKSLSPGIYVQGRRKVVIRK